MKFLLILIIFIATYCIIDLIYCAIKFCRKKKPAKSNNRIKEKGKEFYKNCIIVDIVTILSLTIGFITGYFI